ncbi:hypothetical protein ABPG74_010247 [Tetrahymena malaccensis]
MSSLFCETLNELAITNFQYLKTCIKAYKPHFIIEHIEQFKKSNYLQCNDQYDCRKEYIQKNKMRQLQIFDQQQNVKKLLFVFNQKCFYENDLKTIKQVFKNSLTRNLILNLYDSYILDPEGTFYVFETECYDLNSEVLSEKCYISSNQIENITKKQINFIFQLLGIKSQDNQLSAPIYVNLINEKEIQVKLNIFDFFEQIQTLQQEKSYSYMKIPYFDEEKNQKIPQSDEIDLNFISLIKKQLLDYEQNAFIPISKQKLQKKIQSIQLENQKTHSFKIFEVISEHPQYNNFELISIDSNPFELKLTKREKNIFLIGIQFNTLNEALKTEKEYSKLQSLSGKFKSNLIETQTFELENCSYLLLEFEQSSYDDEQFQSMNELIFKQENDSQEMKIQKAYVFLLNFIDISYDLLTNYNINITSIDPDKILVQKQNIQQGFDAIFINKDSFKNCKSEYIKLISKIFESLNFNYKQSITFQSNQFQPDINHYRFIISYMEMISNSSNQDTQEIQNSYNNIKKMLKFLEFVIEQNKNNNNNFNLMISENNPYKLSINFRNSYYDESNEENIESFKNSMSFLIKNQDIIQKVEFKTNSNYSKMFNQQDQQNQLYFQNARQPFFNSQQLLQQNQSQQINSVLLNKKILEQIGISNSQDYNSQNIGLSVCQNLKNLQILTLEFIEGFNFNIVNQDSNFLRLSDQIISLELIFKCNDDNIINLILQLQQYKNLNTLNITIYESYNHIKKLEKIIKKNQRLVQIKIKKDWTSFRSFKIEKELGFFF